VSHREYRNLPESWFSEKLKADGFLLDLKGIYRDKLEGLDYWSL